MATVNLGRIKAVFRGAYSGSTAYVIDDIVTHGNETFICIQAHGAGTQATSVTAYWTKMAAKGVDGTDGTDVSTTLTTAGDILYRDGSGLQRLAKPASTMNLQMTSAGVASWAKVDLEAIKSDITALAIREATNESSAAFNLPSSFIETFTDDTNLGTQTDGDRDTTGGYWNTFVMSAEVGGTATASADVDSSISYYTLVDGTLSYTQTSYAHTAQDFSGHPLPGNYTVQGRPGSGSSIVRPAGSDMNYGRQWGINQGNGAGSLGNSPYGNDDDYRYYLGFNGILSGSNQVDYIRQRTSQGSDSLTVTTSDIFQFVRNTTGPTLKLYRGLYNDGGTLLHTFTGYNSSSGGTDAWTFGVGYPQSTGSTPNIMMTDIAYKVNITTLSAASVNATGTLIQSANAVTGTRTTVGGTMCYKDNAGTASIGTDLKIYFTANGGSNWTEAVSYTAITPVYSTGVKMVRLGETTVTGGTDVRYKAVWANQASGSKETQLHAIGINY